MVPMACERATRPAPIASGILAFWRVQWRFLVWPCNVSAVDALPRGLDQVMLKPRGGARPG
ncbi:MAG TPA: hypothetical protein DEP84_21975, partial [Chloroflexi bacterium]|nr:hypothetical protein [Chloroflexota bacterium]